MNRKTRLILFFCFIALLLPVIAVAQQVSMTILHTNDTHGHLLPFSYPAMASVKSEFADLNRRKDIGGIARRATIVNRLRKELNRTGVTVWLVDAGDITDGTPFSTVYHGEADVAAMNALSYDFSVLGNHEFNSSLAQLKKLLALFRYPVLCANVMESSGPPLTKDSEIKQVGPLRIGVFGLVTRDAAAYPAAKESLIIANEMDASRRMTAELRKKADIVIALSHSGEKMDEQIAAGVPGIDIIVGGHSHSRLPSGKLVWHSDQLKAEEVDGTIIVQAHQWGGELGRLDLLFEKHADGTWRVARYRARLIPVTPDIPEDPAIAAIVARYWEPIQARYGEIIGQAAGDFVARGDDLAHYNLVADAIRQIYKTDIEFENMGGIRTELSEGKIAYADVVDMDPFNNTVVTFKIAGRNLKELLTKTQPAVSGIRYKIENGKLVNAMVQGQPIKNNRIYTGATNSYFAAMFMKGISVKDTGKPRIEIIKSYIRKQGIVKPVYDGRRVIFP